MKIVSTFYKESAGFTPRAEVTEDHGIYAINYYTGGGGLFRTDTFPDKPLHYVESIAENWTLSIKMLNE